MPRTSQGPGASGASLDDMTAPCLVDAMSAVAQKLPRLALDDFGTGYSSLPCLGQLPIDVVKLDRLFVADAESNLDKRVLIEATVRVALNPERDAVANAATNPKNIPSLVP